jgi:hypothetical protein
VDWQQQGIAEEESAWIARHWHRLGDGHGKPTLPLWHHSKIVSSSIREDPSHLLPTSLPAVWACHYSSANVQFISNVDRACILLHIPCVLHCTNSSGHTWRLLAALDLCTGTVSARAAHYRMQLLGARQLQPSTVQNAQCTNGSTCIQFSWLTASCSLS